MSWKVLFTKQAQKDARQLASASPALKVKAQELPNRGTLLIDGVLVGHQVG